MNNLLKWSIEASASASDPSSPAPPPRPIDPAALQALLGGPSDADLMRESMSIIQDPTIALPSKLTAFDNFKQLIESIDNANHLEPLGLWTPLVKLLADEEAELRRMAAWCVGTAVQNNPKSQERALVVGAVPLLVGMAAKEKQESVRRKAVYALSSLMRNFQRGVDEVLRQVSEDVRGDGKVEAGSMEEVDGLVEKIKTEGGKAHEEKTEGGQ